MKTNDFYDLPVGTTVLLRPMGPGATRPEAKNELVLARISHPDRLRKPPDGGFRISSTGTHRYVETISRLPEERADDGHENWNTLSGGRVGVTASQVVGVWAEVREEVLTRRRERFHAQEAALQLRKERLTAKERELQEALAVVTPVLDALQFPDRHPSRVRWAGPEGRTFTTEEVAQIITAFKDERL